MTAALIEAARKQAELNRTEGWNGNDCDTAMRQLNALADALEAALAREAKLLHALEPMGDVMRVLAGEAPQQAELRKLHEQMEKLKREEPKR